MERTTFTALFYIKRTKLLSNGEAPIYLRITINGEKAEMSLKRSINPQNWDTSKNLCKGRGKKEIEINDFINKLKGQIYFFQSKLQGEGKTVTPEEIINLLSGKGQKVLTIDKLFEIHNSRIEELVNKQYSPATLEKYKVSRKHLLSFIKEVFNKDDFPISEIDNSFITGYAHFLKSKKNCQHNSAMKYMKALKKLIKEALANNQISKDPFVNYKISIEQTERGFLTNDELEKIREKIFSINRLEQVKDVFIFQCFTGLSYIDLEALNENHLMRGIDGKKWIYINRGKNNNSCHIPLLPQAEAIINKYKNNPLIQSTGKLLPVSSNQKLNAYLKEIAVLCGINKNLTTHLARHTFATTITLSNGIPIETVSRVLGHKKLQTTQIYSRVVDNKISEDFRGLENKISFG